eukprot:TRINITY_DN1727_c0_g1_i5.p1 TRINITY_DN1727_c0_g1~~TRINITY_DN1727_c0_g1_i5.p1  ORF type:complete len:351 (-),score=90.98 TRINITY_DN1727_c0_g1_i5:38-1090(-)
MPWERLGNLRLLCVLRLAQLQRQEHAGVRFRSTCRTRWCGLPNRELQLGSEMAALGEYQQIKVSVDNGVCVVTLYRPEKHNTFTDVMARELNSVFGAIDQDDSIRAVVLTGEGKVFCAGADLSSGGNTFNYAARTGKSTKRLVSESRDAGGFVSLAIYHCRKPVIAAINGNAVGIGITMTLACDVRVVAEDAKIGFVFVRRGIVAEAASSYFLTRAVGVNKALEWTLTGRVFSPKEEAQSGLFNHILPQQQVLPRALSIAREIADYAAPVSVVLTKRLMWRGLDNNTAEQAHLLDSRCVNWIGQQPDAKEGVMSFLEKRKPKFTMSPTEDLPDFFPWWTEINTAGARAKL